METTVEIVSLLESVLQCDPNHPARATTTATRSRRRAIPGERGAQADEAYMAWCSSGGFYPAIYYPHNLQFL